MADSGLILEQSGEVFGKRHGAGEARGNRIQHVEGIVLLFDDQIVDQLPLPVHELGADVVVRDLDRGAEENLIETRGDDVERQLSELARELLAFGRSAELADRYSGFTHFVIERDANWPNVIHLVGMDSPGLTSALAIAQHVAKMVSEAA